MLALFRGRTRKAASDKDPLLSASPRRKRWSTSRTKAYVSRLQQMGRSGGQRTKASYVIQTVLLVLVTQFANAQSSIKPSKVPADSVNASGIRKESLPDGSRPNSTGPSVSAEERIASYTYWLMWFTGALATVSVVQIIFLSRSDKTARIAANAAQKSAEAAIASVAGMEGQQKAMEGQVNKMGEIAAAVEASARAATDAVATTKEMNARMKQVSELQSRAFLSVKLGGVIPQDIPNGLRFEPRMLLVNDGNTPAYNVTFRTAADVLPLPLPEDFDFPLPDQSPERSASVIGSRQEKIISAVVARVYSDEDVSQLMRRDRTALYVWGQVNYTDAFGIDRFVRFSNSFAWMKNGNVMSYDTREHNDSD